MKTVVAVPERANVILQSGIDTPSQQFAHQASSPKRLADLVAERKHFELTVYRTTNQHLYRLLTDCYSYADIMRVPDHGELYRAELDRFIAENEVPVTDEMDDLAKVLRCVFFDGVQFVDRRRISTYGIVIREAIKANKPPAQLQAFIEESGGIEEIRLSRTPSRNRERRDTPVTAIPSTELAQVQSEALITAAGARTGQQVLLVAELLPAGAFSIVGIVSERRIVRAALGAHFARTPGAADEKAKKKSERWIKRNTRAGLAHEKETAFSRLFEIERDTGAVAGSAEDILAAARERASERQASAGASPSRDKSGKLDEVR